MVKKGLLIVCLFIVGFFCGAKFTLNQQCITSVVHNPNGYDVYTISIYGQDFNYLENIESYQSIND